MGRLVAWIVLCSLGLGVAAGLWGGVSALASSQVAYWSAVLVVAASFGSYRRMVRQRLDAGMVGELPHEPLEQIEDPYGLYEEEDSTEPDPRELVREEKRRLRKQRRSILQTGKDAAPSFSLWRVGAYGILAAGFFFLREEGLLNLAAYLLSLGLPILLVVWVLLSDGVQDA